MNKYNYIFNLYSPLKFLVCIFYLFLTSAPAFAGVSKEQCLALAPQTSNDVQESFKGDIEGKLGGIIGKLSGGIAKLQGEYNKVAKDTLKDYPESHRLYVWQRLIYLTCINPDSGIDLNELAKAYLTGPSAFATGAISQNYDVDIQVAGFDRNSSHEIISYYGNPGSSQNLIPDVIFMFKNGSKADVNITFDQCNFVNFKLPKPVSVPTSNMGSAFGTKQINSITGAVMLNEIGGSGNFQIPAGEKKLLSFKFFSIETPSFNARQEGTSKCKFFVGAGNTQKKKEFLINSQGNYF